MKKKERMRGKDNAKLVEAEVQGRDLPPPLHDSNEQGIGGWRREERKRGGEREGEEEAEEDDGESWRRGNQIERKKKNKKNKAKQKS